MFLWGVISFAAGEEEEGGVVVVVDEGLGMLLRGPGKRQSRGRRHWAALWSPADSGE